MIIDREKEREAELEGALYTNCLLLGLDPSILNAGASSGSPRVGQFRHPNPKLGEQLLYFLMCSLRGPTQSAKDFDRVWPIFDSAQARDFRKVLKSISSLSISCKLVLWRFLLLKVSTIRQIIQGIITDLEAEGAIPKSNSRVSSLATCCGPRFVELLWQLSLHALKEVHKRTFMADVTSNPLPAPLTDESYAHATALHPVTKARIALERRKFLKIANAAVQNQALWSKYSQDLTAEYRSLCAQEAYLQQEIERLQDSVNKMNLEELFNEHRSCSSDKSLGLVSRATQLWDSLLARKSEHECLASGPIEDLVAHREHRYHISGSVLLAAMNQCSDAPETDRLSASCTESVSACSFEISSKVTEGLANFSQYQQGNGNLQRVEDRGGRLHQFVDVAEMIRGWSHALQRIHKQSLHLVKANEGEGPDLFRCQSDRGQGSHAESLDATLAEHRHHFANIQAFINQLKEAAPSGEKAVADITEEVNSILSASHMAGDRMSFLNRTECGGRIDNVADVASQLSSLQLEEVSVNPLKLPKLFSSTTSSDKMSHSRIWHASPSVVETAHLPDPRPLDQPLVDRNCNNLIQGRTVVDGSSIQSIKRSVREAALVSSNHSVLSPDSAKTGSLKHYFLPTSGSTSGSPICPKINAKFLDYFSDKSECSNVLNHKSLSFNCETTNEYLLDNANCDEPKSHREAEKNSPEHVFSPPLLMDSFVLGDVYEDLLAPLSDAEVALMDC